jgi:hypothetical protein
MKALPSSDQDEEKKSPPPEPEESATEVKKPALPPDLVNQAEAEEATKEPTVEPPDPDEQRTGPDEDVTPFDDEKTAEAISEIVAKEGDDILAAQDAAAGKGGVKPPGKQGRRGGFFRHKWLRYTLFILVFGGLVAAGVVPKSRYWALNTAGVRSSSTVMVLDSTTELPLKGVQVSLAGRQASTDKDGKVRFTDLRLGPTELSITQVGFEVIKRNVVVGWGSNPLGSFALKATGVQYVIEVDDFLSGQPIEGVEATDGEASAVSDKEGKITLTLESQVAVKDGVTLAKAGYRTEKITLSENPKKTTKVKLVLARKVVFVTKQSGKYDLYKTDLDGKNREVLLPGTGHETSNISLAVSPDGNRVAYVSTRANKRDSDGFLLSNLLLINTSSGDTVTIAEGSQIQLIDWIGTRIIFQVAAADGAGGDRYTVVSYSYPGNTRLQLASANQLRAVISAQGNIYYALAADSAKPSLQLGLFKIKPDGLGKQRVFEEEPTTVLRTTYNTLSVQTTEGTWYTYNLASGAKTEVDAPTSLASRLYADNADRSRSLWVDQGTLKTYKIKGGKETDLKSQSGLTYPLSWLDSTVAIYRVSNSSETADYAVSIEGGAARKISNVSPTYGFAHTQ